MKVGKTQLRPLLMHQRTAHDAAVERSPDLSELGLFLDMRLGKSTLLLRLWREACRRVLIAAPGMPIEDWLGEGTREGWWVPTPVRGSAMLSMVARDIANRAPQTWNGKPTLVMTTHETLRAASPEVLEGLVATFDAIAIDESTAIKNPKAQLTKKVLKYLSKARRRAILSGLPHPQGIQEIWAQMAFLKGGSWMGYNNFFKWRSKYFWSPPWDPYDWRPTNHHAAAIRAAMHRDAVVMTAKDAGLDRVVTRHRVEAPLHPAAAKLAKSVRETWCWPGFGDAHAAKHSMVIAGWLHNIEGGCNPAGAPVPCWKPDALRKILSEQLQAEEAVVIWCAGKAEAPIILQAVEACDRPCRILNGDTPQADRKKILDEWRSMARSKHGPCLIASPTLAKWGLDMSQANTQVWWSRPWSFENNRQAEARTMHPTKHEPTAIIDLVTTDGADEEVLLGIEERRENARWYAERIAGPCPGGSK